MARRPYLLLVACAGSTLFGSAAPALSLLPGRLRIPAPVGTVDTVAGPGFCPRPAIPDPASAGVGGLAADAGNRLWFESGDLGEGMVTKVLNSTTVAVERTGKSVGERGPQSGEASSARPSSAARLAPDGNGGILVAKPTAVLHLAVGLTTLAGTTQAAATTGAPEPGTSVGDGGPFGLARFNQIVAIATDAAGNAYVADQIEHRSGTVAIRFLNRSPEAVSFYAGTASQLIVAPGTIDTIAGGVTRGDGTSLRQSRLVAMAPALAVAKQGLYVSATLPGPRPRAVVRLLNLAGTDVSAHGTTVRPAAMATVAVVTGTARSETLQGFYPVVPGIAADSEGNLFMAEPANHRVRRVDADGVLTTFAGTGAAGFNGNDRPAVTARLNRPYDVEVGPGGRVFISDAGNGLVRFVDQAGTIRVASGNGAATLWNCSRSAGSGTVTELGRSSAATTGTPLNLAVGAAGEVYIANTAPGQVHRLSRSGGLRPVAGTPPGSSCAEPITCKAQEEGTALTTAFVGLAAVAVRPGGGLYVQDENQIRFVNLGPRPLRLHGVVAAPGTVRTVAGQAKPGEAVPRASPAADDGVSALTTTVTTNRTRFGNLGALAADHKGNLLVADYRNGRVRQVDPDGKITTLIATPGRGVHGKCCSGPTGLAVDAADNVYVADPEFSGRVWFFNRGTSTVVAHGVSIAPGAVQAVAGVATGEEGSRDDGGPALESQLAGPWGVTVDGSNNLYVISLFDNAVRRIDDRGIITTVVGTGQRGFNGDGLKGALTALNLPLHIVVDACDNLLVADSGNDRVRRVNLVTSCPAAAPASATSAGHPIAAIAATGLALGAVALLVVHRVLKGVQGRRRRAPRSANVAETE